jgi:hypothetical protein
MRLLRTATWLLLFVLAVVPVMAVADCPSVVENALEATDEICETTGRNQACYGNAQIDAQPQTGIEDFTFEDVGDRVPVTALQSLRLSPMEIETGEWGVAMMRLQASLPSSQREDITLLMFGDVQIENAVSTPQVTMDVTVSVDEYINVRRLPSTRAGVMGVLAPGQTVRALERLENSTWLRVEIPSSGVIGWLDSSLVTSDDDMETLAVSAPWVPRYRPMQAFYFQSGATDAACGEAPTSGLLIQTPEGVGHVNLLINEVNVRIGSTALFQASPGGELRVSTVEGSVEIEAMGGTSTVPAGSQASVQMDEHNEPAAPPSNPVPYNQQEWEELPLGSLGDQVGDIPDPLTDEEIEAVVAANAVANPNQAASADTQQTITADTSAPAPSTGGVSVVSVCAGEWAVINTTAFEIAYQWDAVGNGASGGGMVGPNGESGFSVNAQSVSIAYEGGSASASSNGEPCAGEAPVPTEEAVPPTIEPDPSPGVVPPTEEPLEPTAEPPTAVPPTVAPPTPEPPTEEPPTEEPSTPDVAGEPPPSPPTEEPSPEPPPEE